MSDLCERLQDVDEAGVYRLTCPVEVLYGNVALSGLRLIEVDLEGAHGKGEFLAAVAKAMQAPEWFGHNFDALADALGDLSWLETEKDGSKGYVLLLLNGGDSFGMSHADHAEVIEIFGDACAFWKSQGVPFWVLYV